MLKSKIFRICICYIDGWPKLGGKGLQMIWFIWIIFPHRNSFHFYTPFYISGFSKEVKDWKLLVFLISLGIFISVAGDDVIQFEGFQGKAHSWVCALIPSCGQCILTQQVKTCLEEDRRVEVGDIRIGALRMHISLRWWKSDVGCSDEMLYIFHYIILRTRPVLSGGYYSGNF